MGTLTGIRVLRKVIEAGSFVEGFELSTAMVNRHIMHIERRLASETAAPWASPRRGECILSACKTILDDLEATELEPRWP